VVHVHNHDAETRCHPRGRRSALCGRSSRLTHASCARLAQVRELEASESDLMMARKELHSAVDRLADDKARAERLARMALKKGDALKRQVEMFASLPPSKPLLPLGGVKSAKADKADKLKRPGRERERDGVENRAPRR
jgi:hypothetical protein